MMLVLLPLCGFLAARDPIAFWCVYEDSIISYLGGYGKEADL